MKNILIVTLLLLPLLAHAAELPLYTDDLKVMQQIVVCEQLGAMPEVNPKQG